MSECSLIAGLLAAMIHDTCWGNRWHSLASAAEELTNEDLSFKPLEGMHSPRWVLRHTAACARWYAEGLAPRTDDPSEDAWDGVVGRRSGTADGLVKVTDTACRCLWARACSLEDAQLCEPSGVWNGASKAFVLMGGGVLHAAWHFGQIALLARWSHASRHAPMTPVPGPAGDERPARRSPEWARFTPGDRKDACLAILRAAYRDSGWPALRSRVQGMSDGEMAWSPFENMWGPRIAEHVAACKVVYADQAFGAAKMTWDDCERVLGSLGDRPDGARMAAVLDRAQEFLLDHVARADEEALDRTYPMHHGHPLTGWQVVAAMAQHDAWHAGQIVLMREAYRRLALSGT